MADNLCVPGFNAPVMHRHSALSCFVARAMPSVPPAVAGNSGPRGVLGGVSDDLLAENLCVAGFNPPVMHRHGVLSCFVARAISSVLPAVAGNSGPSGVLGKLRLFVDWKPMCGRIQAAERCTSIPRCPASRRPMARATPSVPSALAGNSGLRGVLKRGGLGLSVDFENLGVGGFNPASDTWA